MEKDTDIKTNSQKAIEELKEAIKDYIRKDKPIKSNTMKKFLLISGLMILISFSLLAQDSNKDFVVVGQVASDLNMQQVQIRYSNKMNVLFLADSETNGVDQITATIEGKSFENLHIFLQSTPSSLIFNSLVITKDNVSQLKDSLKKWKSAISGRVIIHSTIVLDENEAAEIKLALEKYAGIEFTITI